MKLILVAKRPETEDAASFIFRSDAPLTWQAGQLLSYTLPHPDPDDRGITRYFTIASAPFEGHVMLTTRFANGRSSSFKRALRQLPAGAVVEVGEPDGDFVLGDPSGEHVLLAGASGSPRFGPSFSISTTVSCPSTRRCCTRTARRTSCTGAKSTDWPVGTLAS